MSMRTRLLSSVAIAGLVTAAIVLVLLQSTREVDRLQAQEQRAADLSTAAAQLGNLTFEYLLAPDARIVSQWRAMAGQAGGYAQQLTVNGAQERALRASARAGVGTSAQLFARLVAVAPRDPGARAIVAEALELKTEQLAATASQLQRLRRAHTRAAIHGELRFMAPTCEC
jgi:hypothetical protein